MNKVLPLLTLAVSLTPVKADDSPFAFQLKENSLQISAAAKPFASYVFKDDKLPRPYFAHVCAPGGIQVTRNHPPIGGKDDTDHATFHPGLWLAFGELGGGDFWRNRSSVEHVEFILGPRQTKAGASFVIKNRYRASGKIVCEETCRITVLARPAAYLMLWDSQFRGPSEFTFGDQEEMGLGVRLATPLTVKKGGGQIVNSAGAKNEKQVWGKQAEWCDYGGMLGGQRTGVVLMPHPSNFRPSWFHARDYGLLVANPFGQNAFTRGKKSAVTVRPGDSLRLRFGVLVYAGAVDVSSAYQDYLQLEK